MTTETRVTNRDTVRFTGVSVLVKATVAAFGAGLVVVALAAIIDGGSAVVSALVGTAIVVAVFAFGAFVVNAVAGLLPAASLLVALLTYTLQVVLMAMVFVALSTTGGPGDDLDRGWLGAAVIAGTAGWLVAQLTLATRLRLPAYELPEQGTGDEGSEAPPGGER